MPEIVLNGASVLAVVCELIAARMPQHVTVNEEGEARGLASSRQRRGEPGVRKQTRRCLRASHALAAAGRAVLGLRSGERWPCRPWCAERAVFRFRSRCHPNAGPRARWLANRGGRRSGWPWRPRSVTVLIGLASVTEGKERRSTWVKSQVGTSPGQCPLYPQ
jgi:hypothetical protein